MRWRGFTEGDPSSRSRLLGWRDNQSRKAQPQGKEMLNRNDLFKQMKTSSSAVDEDVQLDNLKRELSRNGCQVFEALEGIVRHQLANMVREANGFEDLLTRLNMAGVEYLSTPHSAAHPEGRENQTVQAAHGILERNYRADVVSCADSIRGSIQNEEIEDFEALDQFIHETIDGASRVIYTEQARDACIYSGNEAAWQEVHDEVPVSGGEVDWSIMAFYCFRADVLEELGDIASDAVQFTLHQARNPKGFKVTWGSAKEILGEAEADHEEYDVEDTVVGSWHGGSAICLVKAEGDAWVLAVEGTGTRLFVTEEQIPELFAERS